MLNKDNNPWLGLASYEYEDSYRFFGREKELEKLMDCICNNLITTIYGISGSGKTSLINAGMCPLIEKENYLPVRIRLEHGSNRTYSEQIIKAVTEAITKANGEIETNDHIESTEMVPESEKLWLFFYASSFWSATNHHLYPVVFIDQFEEIFTKNDNDEVVHTFFESISALQYDTPPATITHLLETEDRHTSLNITQDFRVVLIMREDFLARLEDYAYDSPALRKNRVGIKRMNGNQALEVITRPQPGLVSRDVALNIIAKVAGREIKDTPSFLEQLSVDTSLLSLFCSEVYLKAADQKHDTITRELIDQFGENILASFYTNTMKLVPLQTADYLETHLLTRSGFRNAVAMEDIVADGIHKEDLDKLCAKRLIRIETSEGTERVEFTHDVLCAIAKEHRDKALEKSQRKQSNNRTIGFFIDLALPLMILIPAFFHLYLNHTPDNFLGIAHEENVILILAAIGFIILLFNIFMLFPYRHSKDRNTIFHAFLTFIFNSTALIFVIGVSFKQFEGYSMVLWIINLVYFLILFLNSFRFNRKRSFKEALGYTFSCKVYKEHPEMLTILKATALVLLFFISFLVGISMNIKIAYITAPICSLLALWILLDLLGQSVDFDRNSILYYALQSSLILLMLAFQFHRHHLAVTISCLALLCALTIYHIHNDSAFVPQNKRIRNVLLIWLLTSVILPSVNLGYNPFRLPKYHLATNGLIKNYKLTRFLVVEDVHHKQGVRDRWNMVVPVEFDSVKREVFIDFNEDNMTGFISIEEYYSPYISNDIAFTVYNNGDSNRWLCSEHLDMENIGTTLIIESRINAATKSSDNLQSFLSTYKEVDQPYMIEYTIEKYIKNNVSNNFSSRASTTAWFWLFTGDFAKSEEYAVQAIKADSSNLYAYGNLFNAQYLLNKREEAFTIFNAHKNDTINGMSFEEAIIKDFEELVQYKVIEEPIKTELDSILKQR